MVVLREAEAADTGEMARIQVESIRDGAEEHYNEEQLAVLAPLDYGPELINPSIFDDADTYAVVAERDRNCVGVAVLQSADGYLAGLFVDPAHKGDGVGTVLFDHVEKHAREVGVETLTVVAGLNAVDFYERAGFARMGQTTVGTDDTDIPAVEMEKPL